MNGKSIAAALAAVALGGCMTTTRDTVPATTTASADSIDARVAALLARMSVEDKVAQLVMPDIASITSDDVRRYRFGTILNGGNSGPGGNDKAPAAEWLKLADAMWEASTAPRDDGRPVVPLLWATDAVHGHNNIPGATVFPHNIGLGAAGDVDLVRRIGQATAAEIAATGIDWTFAPTLAVTRDDRWGRTYESYAEEPELVARLGMALVEGLQGRQGTPEFLDQRRVIATAKHFFADGGTGGIDQGDARGDVDELIALHATPYIPSIDAGVQSVMASFSSINGEKLHGSRAMLTDLLRGQMKFDGLTVGDWNGHGQLPGCSNADCPDALLAGLDVYMVPEDWRGLHASLVEQVASGKVPMARLDKAAGRVLALKLRYGLMTKPRPSERTLGGRFETLGSPEHRAIGREAVRKSLVLLKNDGVLPIKSSARILVAGAGADNIAQQAGGWSISWQGGGDLTNADFPGATSIYRGIADALAQGGGRATLSADGRYSERPDAAIVVFGEPPYAEFSGDRRDLAYRDATSLALMQKLRGDGIPVVAVFLSGRPMWVNPLLEASDAFVAAWLPGSEGGGVADVLIGDSAARPRHDFTGRLSFTWPADCAQPVNNDGARTALFARGTGYGYTAPPPRRTFATECALTDNAAQDSVPLFDRRVGDQTRFAATDPGGVAPLDNFLGRSTQGTLIVRGIDRNAQEDARAIRWTAPADLTVHLPPLAQALPERAVLVIEYRVDRRPVAPVTLSGRGQPLSLAEALTIAEAKGWRDLRIPLACLGPDTPGSLTLHSEAAFAMEVSALRIEAGTGPQTEDCSVR